jgi:integrase
MASRRGNNEGSITRRSDGRWVARITLEGGKRKHYYAKTRQEAARLLTSGLRDREAGLPIVGDRQTVGQYLTSWLSIIEHSVKPRSHQSYVSVVRLYLLPTLGNVALSKLTAQQIQTIYARKLKEGLSPTTVRHFHAVLHKALDNAVRLGLVPRNVADLVQTPRIRRQDMMTLTAEQAKALLSTAVGNRFEALYVLALMTGLRQGELFGLKWHDIDFDAGLLSVQRTLNVLAGKLVFAEPKTEMSRRNIVLPRRALRALATHRARQTEERALFGEAWTDLGLVFPNTIGYPEDASSFVRRDFRPLLRQTGLPRIRFHDLRHTAATLLLEEGINPKVVSEMLGHAHISITLAIYGHVTPKMRQAAARAMDEVLGD